MINFVAGDLTFGAKIRMVFPKVPWMPESLSGSEVWWWSYMHTNGVLCMLVVSNISSRYG